jgi:MFS family permease
MDRRLFHGWYVVLCCFGIALFGWGLGFYGPSVYLVRLREAHGWSTGAISVALTVYNLVMAALIMHVGDAIARWGARRVILAGSLGLGLGAACLPVVDALWQLYVALFVMALCYGVSGGAAISAILAEWFDAKRGLAISLALNGASVAGIIISPAMIWLTGRFGFAFGLWILIAAMWALLWPPAIVLLRRPRELGLWPDGAAAPVRPVGSAPEPPVRRAVLLADRGFQSVTAAFGLGLAAQVGFLMHQVAFLTGRVGIDGAAAGVALTTTVAVLSRIGTGLVIDRFDPRRTAAGNFIVQIAALAVLLWAPTAGAIYLGCALFGISVGNMITLPNLIVQREFASAQFARAVSLVWAIVQVTLAFGPGVLGIVHDWSGDYTAALAVCLALDVAALLAVLVRRRTDAVV